MCQKENTVASYKKIVVLTGAGVSAESGVATFRENGGLWEQHRIEDVATPEAFARDPDLVQNFYNMRRAQLSAVEPNAAHRALGMLEKKFNGEVTIVTQNVDNLHERGGSSNIIHMHGELTKVRCICCRNIFKWPDDCTQASQCPSCFNQPALRPHIVWFGEMPFEMERIENLLGACDLFISIGTSGSVYPASGFVSLVRSIGTAHTIEVNLDPSEGASYFAETRHGKAGSLVPLLVDELLT